MVKNCSLDSAYRTPPRVAFSNHLQISRGTSTGGCKLLILFRTLVFRFSRHEVENHACWYIAMFEPIEDLVNRRKGLQLDIGFNLASDGEGESFGHILARADERTAD